MKTSNKILLCLVVIIFTVPFLLAASLKSKMKKGEYTVVKNENTRSGNTHSGSFTAFKVVKVVAPGPDFLICHLKLSDNMNYKYNLNTKEDSIIIFTSNDTLLIKYVTKKVITDQIEIREYNGTAIYVNLPAFNNLVVDGAVVVIDSLPASSGNLSVILKNKGEIKDGSENREKQSLKESPAVSMQKEKTLQASEIYEAKIASKNEKLSMETIQNPGLEILDWDIKHLLFIACFKGI